MAKQKNNAKHLDNDSKSSIDYNTIYSHHDITLILYIVKSNTEA